MPDEAKRIGYTLLSQGVGVRFRIDSEEVLEAPSDEAEFGLRLKLKFIADEDDDEADEDDVAEDIAESAALGFLFTLAVLSFADAKPRNVSIIEYEEKDELRLADFIQHLSFIRGELHFDADYIRGRRIKTRAAVSSDGIVRLETLGRGKAALRWLEQLQGKKLMQLVNPG